MCEGFLRFNYFSNNFVVKRIFHRVFFLDVLSHTHTFAHIKECRHDLLVVHPFDKFMYHRQSYIHPNTQIWDIFLRIKYR